MNKPECKTYPNGDKVWYLNGKHHREDGPACEWANGYKVWCLNGKRHREDGPAIECVDGTKEWWLNGKRHREDGPAIIDAYGNKGWCLDGALVSPETLVDRYLAQNIYCFYNSETDSLEFE